MRIAILPILALCVLSVSCSDSSPPAAAQKQKTAIDAQLKAIDKAKAVQDTVNQRAGNLDKQMEQQENGGSSKQGEQQQ